MRYDISNPPPRVLLLDAPAAGTPQPNFNYGACAAFFRSLGCIVAEYNQNDISAGHQVCRDDWDLVCYPNITITAEGSTMQSVLALFDKTPPTYLANMLNGGASGAARAITGIDSTGSTGDVVTTGLINWQNRKSKRVTFYSTPATGVQPDVTVHAQDDAGNMALISRAISGSNTLMQVGYNSTNSTIVKPWLGAQWMIDNASPARAQQIRSWIKKRRCLLRIDGLSDTNSMNAYNEGNLQVIYDSLLEHGVKECWVAAIWGVASSADTLDKSNKAVLDWYKARAETAVGEGGLFRITNHEIDVYNGTVTIDGNAEACSSDGKLFDQFRSADYAYRWGCDQLTAYGFILGTDGYGRDYPHVQDGNDMGNPSAKFLGSNTGIYDTDSFYGGFGCHLMLSGDEGYPTPEATKISIHGSMRWYDAQTVLMYSEDAINPASAANVSVTWNADIVRALINGGGIYYHPSDVSNSKYFSQYVDEYGQLFTSCPDVLDSGMWEDMLLDLKRGNGVFFDL